MLWVLLEFGRPAITSSPNHERDRFCLCLFISLTFLLNQLSKLGNSLSPSFPKKSLKIHFETRLLLGFLALYGYSLNKLHKSVNLASTSVKWEQLCHPHGGLIMRIKWRICNKSIQVTLEPPQPLSSHMISLTRRNKCLPCNGVYLNVLKELTAPKTVRNWRALTQEKIEMLRGGTKLALETTFPSPTGICQFKPWCVRCPKAQWNLPQNHGAKETKVGIWSPYKHHRF